MLMVFWVFIYLYKYYNAYYTQCTYPTYTPIFYILYKFDILTNNYINFVNIKSLLKFCNEALHTRNVLKLSNGLKFSTIYSSTIMCMNYITFNLRHCNSEY